MFKRINECRGLFMALVLLGAGFGVTASCLLDSGGGESSSTDKHLYPMSFRDDPASLPVDELIKDLFALDRGNSSVRLLNRQGWVEIESRYGLGSL